MAKNCAEFEPNTCSSKALNNLLQHGHEIIASIPVFTSSVTRPKHSANLEGCGRVQTLSLDFMVKKCMNKTNYFGILNSTLYGDKTAKIL